MYRSSSRERARSVDRGARDRVDGEGRGDDRREPSTGRVTTASGGQKPSATDGPTGRTTTRTGSRHLPEHEPDRRSRPELAPVDLHARLRDDVLGLERTARPRARASPLSTGRASGCVTPERDDVLDRAVEELRQEVAVPLERRVLARALEHRHGAALGNALVDPAPLELRPVEDVPLRRIERATPDEHRVQEEDRDERADREPSAARGRGRPRRAGRRPGAP